MGFFNVSANSREAISLTPIQAALADRLCELVDGLPSARRHSLAKLTKGLTIDEESRKKGCKENCEETAETGKAGVREGSQCVDRSN